MAEEKQKSFGIILKSAKVKKQKEEKKLNTIISCCVSAIFLITIFVPFLTGGEDKSSGNSYKNVAFDLADLEIDDEAEKVLLEMNKYSDIPQKQIAGGLFSKKQKEERKEVDKKKGLPLAADKEYLQARKAKQKKQNKKRTGVSRPATTSSPRQSTRTSTGNLQRGSNVSVGSGSSGVSSSIWTSRDKDSQKGAKGGTTGSLGTQQLVAATGAKGRASGLLRAIEESQKGANSENLDTAGQAAADAFTNNNLEAEDDGLTDGMDEFAEKFNPEELKGALNDDDLTDLGNKLNDAKDDGTADDDSKNCEKAENAMSFQCFLAPALMDFAKQLVGVGLNMLSYYGQSAIDAKFGTDSTKSAKGFNLFHQQQAQQAQYLLNQYGPNNSFGMNNVYGNSTYSNPYGFGYGINNRINTFQF